MGGAFEDDDYLPISGLQHLAFCERQCALIHVERIWRENALTAEGRVVHERAHMPGLAEGGRVAYALRLRSDRLRLIGQADVVEFLPHPTGAGENAYPIEYKRGTKGEHLADRIQLCAQAMALEEMTGNPIPKGALYYHASKHRVEVLFIHELRRETERLAREFHNLVREQRLPPGIRQAKCERCSLVDACQPSVGITLPSYVKALLDSLSGKLKQ